jgi:urease accessory protein
MAIVNNQAAASKPTALKKPKGRPHPGPLPRGEGEIVSARRRNHDSRRANATEKSFKTVAERGGAKAKSNGKMAHPALPEKMSGMKIFPNGISCFEPLNRRKVARPSPAASAGGVSPPVLSPGETPGKPAGGDAGATRFVRRTEVSTNFLSADWRLWQLADSAFPTGGFAHSFGLEAAWQHGEVRNRTELVSFLEAGLHQAGHAALPFVLAAFDAPEKLDEFDQLCEAFTTNHVANRASRAQGRALLSAMEKIFNIGGSRGGEAHAKKSQNLLTSAATKPAGPPPFAHFAPVFGAYLRRLEVARETTGRMFLFNHLRGGLAAAVRLNIVGPMEAQNLQARLAPTAEKILQRCAALTLDELAQTSPLLDLWQGAQDRLYSRLFQS